MTLVGDRLKLLFTCSNSAPQMIHGWNWGTKSYSEKKCLGCTRLPEVIYLDSAHEEGEVLCRP